MSVVLPDSQKNREQQGKRAHQPRESGMSRRFVETTEEQKEKKVGATSFRCSERLVTMIFGTSFIVVASIFSLILNA